jgi:hypothetical protein
MREMAAVKVLAWLVLGGLLAGVALVLAAVAVWTIVAFSR